MNGKNLCIEGPQKMQGELLVQGSKNTALPVLAATLLGKGVFVLHHCPKISDVEHMLEMLEVAGCTVGREGHMLLIDTRQADQYCVTGNGAGKMRSTDYTAWQHSWKNASGRNSLSGRM